MGIKIKALCIALCCAAVLLDSISAFASMAIDGALLAAVIYFVAICDGKKEKS